MPVFNNPLDAALYTLSARRNRAKEIASERRKELYRHLPRLREIERQLAATAPSLVCAIVSHSDTAAEVQRIREENLSLQQERGHLLETLGLPENYLEPAYACSICHDEGAVAGKRCSCLEKLIREEKLARLNSASSLSLCSFESFRLDYYPAQPDRSGISPRKRMEEILSVCRQYAAQFDPKGGRSLLMLGATGLGKTHLSLAIAASVVAQGHEVVYGSVQDLFRRAEAERFARDGDAGGTTDSLLECGLLILDDLGSEFTTSFTAALLHNIINTRLNCHRPTIISTNLPFKELNAVYADRVVSRLLGGYTVLQFLGSDIRVALSGKQ